MTAYQTKFLAAGYYSALPAGANAGDIENFHVTYLKRDGYLQQATSGSSSTNANLHPATDTSVYNILSQQVAIDESIAGVADDTMRVFAYDGGGEILVRRDGNLVSGAFQQGYNGVTAGTQNQDYAFVDGQQVAHLDQNGLIDVRDGLTAFSNTNLGSSGYVVQTGDTLESIAQAVYGTAALWYVIADANALDSDSDLIVGQRLVMPEVTTTRNDATTFKPYSPQQVVGSTTPALAYIPPPPSQQCNTLTDLIVVVVAAVVTYETMGATSALLENALGTTGGLMTSAAIGGVAGSAAGQLTGDALGVSSGFSLDQALTQGLANGLTAGLTSGLQSSDLSALEQGGKLTALGNLADGAGSYAAGAVAAAIVGEPTQFSWAGMVAAALADAGTADAGLPSSALNSLGPNGQSFAQNLEGGLMNGTLDSALSQAFGDHRVPSWKQIGIDAFGNALGNAAYQGLSHWQAAQAASTTAGIPIGNADITQQIAQDIGTPSLNVSNLAQNPSLDFSGFSAGTVTATSTSTPASLLAASPVIAIPPSGSIPVLPTIVVTPSGSYIQPSAQDEAAYAYYSSLEVESQQATLDAARVNAERWAEQQRQQAIGVRARQIEDAQFAMLGQGLIGAGKAMVNFIPEAINGTLSMARTELGLYGALNGGPLDLLNDPAVASISTPQLPTLGYANAAQAGAGGAAATLLNVATLVGPAVFEAPKLVTAYDAAAAWLSDGAGASDSELVSQIAADNIVPSTGPTLDAYTQGLVDQLRTATLTGGDTATPASALADLSTNVSGDGSRVVLGQWNSVNGGYINEARTNGGIWFQTPDGVYEGLTQGLSAEQGRAVVWNVNQQFLQSNLENGVSEFNLWNETPEDVLINRPNSYTASEVNYLQQNAGQFGYTRQGSSWVKGQ